MAKYLLRQKDSPELIRKLLATRRVYSSEYVMISGLRDCPTSNGNFQVFPWSAIIHDYSLDDFYTGKWADRGLKVTDIDAVLESQFTPQLMKMEQKIRREFLWNQIFFGSGIVVGITLVIVGIFVQMSTLETLLVMVLQPQLLMGVYAIYYMSSKAAIRRWAVSVSRQRRKEIRELLDDWNDSYYYHLNLKWEVGAYCGWLVLKELKGLPVSNSSGTYVSFGSGRTSGHGLNGQNVQNRQQEKLPVARRGTEGDRLSKKDVLVRWSNVAVNSQAKVRDASNDQSLDERMETLTPGSQDPRYSIRTKSSSAPAKIEI